MPIPSVNELAAEYRCNRRTISNWKRAGAPLNDPDAMRVWLLTRKHIPDETRAMLNNEARDRRAAAESKRANKAANDDNDPGSIGAAPALKRLEREELEAHIRLNEAWEGGNLTEIKILQEQWLRTGDSLRKYDLMVEQSRRNSGELVPRGHVETHVARLMHLFKLACVRTASSLAPELAAAATAAEVYDILRDVLLSSILNSLASMATLKAPNRAPDWLVNKFLGTMEDIMSDVGESVKARAKMLEDSAELLAGATAEAIREKLSAAPGRT